jgi:hypothetical protein
MNFLGKFLVLINLALALVLLAWALVLFLQPVDLGWKEPRKAWSGTSADGKKEPNELIASRIDERAAGYKILREDRAAAVANAKVAEDHLKQYEGKFGANRVYYNREFARLEGAPGQIQVAEVKYNKDGTPALIGGKEWSAPVLDQLVPEATKSYKTYLDELFATAEKMKHVAAQIAKVQGEQKKLTERLNGVHKDGKVVEPGYYDLLENEAVAQQKLKAEIEYLQPLWVVELYNAQLLRGRRQGLEKRLKELGGDPSSVLK